jgi:ribosomal protein RSM22 (predicted rRNA methylase)
VILWVEPGQHTSSRALIELRERLRERFAVVAPCTHRLPCGLRSPENEPHWCHHFADPPPGVFTDPFWGRFAAIAGVDLSSLPVSYLVLDRRPVPPLPTGAVRVIGRPRVYKAHAALLACDADGVTEVELRKRDLPEPFRRLRKGDCPSLQVWTRDDRRVVDLPGGGGQ